MAIDGFIPGNLYRTPWEMRGWPPSSDRYDYTDCQTIPDGAAVVCLELMGEFVGRNGLPIYSIKLMSTDGVLIQCDVTFNALCYWKEYV